MASRATGTNSHKICRLCLSAKSLEDIYKHGQLHKWITNFLSIKISNKDSMSQSICAACRKRLIEFHKYWKRCKEVQGILQAKVREEDIRQETEQAKCEVCDKVFKSKKLLNDHKRYHGPKEHACPSCGKSFVRRHELNKHVKVHARGLKIKPKHTSKEKTNSKLNNSNLKTKPGETDDLTSETHSRLEGSKMGVQTDTFSENCNDIDLQQTHVKLELVPVSLPILDDQEEAMDNRRYEDEHKFAIEDIIVIEEVKIETRPDENEEFCNNETLAAIKETDEDKTEIHSKQESEEHLVINDIIVVEEVKIETRPEDNEELSTNENLDTVKEVDEDKSIDKNESNAKHKSTSGDAVDDDGTSSKVKTADDINNSVDHTISTENIGNRYACSKCDRTFNRQCQLKNHMDNHDITEGSTDVNDEDLSTAEDVDLDYSTPATDVAEPIQPKRNIKSTNKGPFQCDICQKVVSDKRKLKDHKRCHKSKDHVCTICERPFLRRPAMLRHMETHTSRPKYQRAKPVIEGPIQCDICQKEFKSKSILYGHKLKVHGPKKHECNICGSRFSDRFTLKMHFKAHVRSRDSEEDFRLFKQMMKTDNTKEADGKTENEPNSSEHTKHKHEGSLKDCGKCKKVFKTQREWLHYKLNHVPKNRLYCSLCSLVFVTRYRLELHMLKHKQENDSSQTATSSSLSVADAVKGIDQSTISSEKNSTSVAQTVQVDKDVGKPLPFQCNICQKIYQTRLKLYLHHRAVHGPKNHNCVICTVRFATRLELKKHLCTKQHMRKLQETLGNNETIIESNGSEKDQGNNSLPLTTEVTEQQEVQCDVCHKFYPNKWRLHNHKRYHGPKVHKCTICEKAFAIREILMKHMRTHRPDNERKRARPALEGEPIKCDVCQKEFRTRATLWSHNKRAHGPKKHECHICGFRYTTSYVLRKHIEMHARHRDSAEEYQSLKQMQQKGKSSLSNENMDNESSEAEKKSTAPTQKQIPADPPTECWKCHKKFKNQKQLGLHYKFKHVSKNIRKCTLCNKYVTKIRFEKHMITKHKDEYAVHQSPTCDICNAVFPTLDQMAKHMEIHGPKKYNCAICEKSFKTSRLLLKHLKFHEMNTGDKQESNQETP